MEGDPELYSEAVREYVYNVFDVAATVIRVVHADGGVRTWTLMSSSCRYPLTFSVYTSPEGTFDQSYCTWS